MDASAKNVEVLRRLPLRDKDSATIRTPATLTGLQRAKFKPTNHVASPWHQPSRQTTYFRVLVTEIPLAQTEILVLPNPADMTLCN
jgi:hypothetical protein